MRNNFLTDNGSEIICKAYSKSGAYQNSFNLERYGAWKWNHSKNKYQCIETSNDLDYLKLKYQTVLVIDLSAGGKK